METNARREQLKRMLVLREIVRGLTRQGNLPVGAYSLELVPRNSGRVKGPHGDMLRFYHGEGGVWTYSAKSRTSSTAKNMKRFEGTGVGGEQKVLTDFDCEKELKKLRDAVSASMLHAGIEGSEWVNAEFSSGIVKAFEEKERLRATVLGFIEQMHSTGYSKELFGRLIGEIDELICEVRKSGFSRREGYQFRERARTFVEGSWPIEFNDAGMIVGIISRAGAQEKLKGAVAEYLGIERENVGRGVLEYQMHEHVLDSVYGLQAALKLVSDYAQNARQEAIDERYLEVGRKFARICDTVLAMEEKLLKVKAARAESFEDGFMLLCEAAKLRSAVLNLIYEVYEDIEKCFPGMRVGYILKPLERLFFELLHVKAEEENKLWKQFVKEVDWCFKKLGKEAKEEGTKWKKIRGRIEKYTKHLREIGELDGQRVAALSEMDIARKEHVKEKSRAEEKLRSKIRELEAIAPIEASVIESGHRAVKTHVRYRLGDWMHNARQYLTAEKLVETLLEKTYSELNADSRFRVYGKPLCEYDGQFRKWMSELIGLNAEIMDRCGRLGIANAVLLRRVERIGYLEANAFDMKVEGDGLVDSLLDKLLVNGALGTDLKAEYEETVEGDELVIRVYSKAFAAPEVRIKREALQDDFIGVRRDIEEMEIGERFKTDDAVMHAQAHFEKQPEDERKTRMYKAFDSYAEGRVGSGYEVVMNYLMDTLERHLHDKAAAVDQDDKFYYAPYWRQTPFNGVFYAPANVENPARLVSTALGTENELETFFRGELGSEFDVHDRRMQQFRERHAMRMMADELHVLFPAVVLEEAQKLVEQLGSTRE